MMTARRYVLAAPEDGGFSIDEAAGLGDASVYVEGVPYDAVLLDEAQGMGTYPGLHHRDCGPGAAAAE